MDPYVAFFLALGTFVTGVFVGWKWRELQLWEEVKKGEFDPWKWGREKEEEWE